MLLPDGLKSFYRTLIGNHICNLSNGITFNDLEWPLTRISRSWHFWSRTSEKTDRLKDKANIAQEETIPNIRNGTVYYVWWPWLPLNVSRGFVSISWASRWLYGVVMQKKTHCIINDCDETPNKCTTLRLFFLLAVRHEVRSCTSVL